MSESGTPRPGGEIVVYQSEGGSNQIRVLLDGETVWLTQQQMADLYQTSVPNVNIHLKNIYADGELNAAATIKDYLIVRHEGSRQVSRRVLHYNLEAILAVGYRVQSPRGTQFRQWATARLNEYLVKGFTLDDERLKGGKGLVDHFDELLARIREIRASEARVYQRIREIFSLASDYREGEEQTQTFFATMQNKMHYAATGMTAAEIVRRRADAGQANMGLTAWKGGRVIKRDVGTAKNYLDAKRDRHPQPYHRDVPRPGRVPRPAAAGHPHGRLGSLPRQVPARHRTSGAFRSGNGQSRSSHRMGGGTIRRIR